MKKRTLRIAAAAVALVFGPTTMATAWSHGNSGGGRGHVPQFNGGDQRSFPQPQMGNRNFGGSVHHPANSGFSPPRPKPVQTVDQFRTPHKPGSMNGYAKPGPSGPLNPPGRTRDTNTFKVSESKLGKFDPKTNQNIKNIMDRTKDLKTNNVGENKLGKLDTKTNQNIKNIMDRTKDLKTNKVDDKKPGKLDTKTTQNIKGFMDNNKAGKARNGKDNKLVPYASVGPGDPSDWQHDPFKNSTGGSTTTGNGPAGPGPTQNTIDLQNGDKMYYTTDPNGQITGPVTYVKKDGTVLTANSIDQNGNPIGPLTKITPDPPVSPGPGVPPTAPEPGPGVPPAAPNPGPGGFPGIGLAGGYLVPGGFGGMSGGYSGGVAEDFGDGGLEYAPEPAPRVLYTTVPRVVNAATVPSDKELEKAYAKDLEKRLAEILDLIDKLVDIQQKQVAQEVKTGVMFDLQKDILKKLWKLEVEAKGGNEDLQKAVSEVRSLVENVMASISAQGHAQDDQATQASN